MNLSPVRFHTPPKKVKQMSPEELKQHKYDLYKRHYNANKEKINAKQKNINVKCIVKIIYLEMRN